MISASIDTKPMSTSSVEAVKIGFPKKRRTKSSSILLESTRQFCEKNRPTIEDISTYKAFFYQFIGTLPDTDKRQVAAILARNPFTPRPIGLYLAMDKLEVAAPFLLFSPILKELDLKAISRKMGEEYANVISRRKDGNEILGVNQANLESSTGVLNERVAYESDAGKDEVILNIDPSDNASLITRPLSDAIKKTTLELDEEILLVSVASKATKLETSKDVAAVVAETVAPKASTTNGLSATTHSKDKTNGIVNQHSTMNKSEYSGSLDMAVEEKDDTWLSSEEIVALASVGGKLGKKQKLDVRNALNSSHKHNAAASSDRLLNKIEIATLIRQARALDHKGFSQTVSHVSGLSNEFILNIIHKKAGDQLLYLITALDIPSPKNLQLLLMLAPKHGRGIDVYMAAKKQFTELNIGICRMIFNEVGAKFEVPGAPKPMRIEGKRQDENFNHSVKMRREHISAISHVDTGRQRKETFSSTASNRKVS